jgi:hypothetical protein
LLVVLLVVGILGVVGLLPSVAVAVALLLALLALLVVEILRRHDVGVCRMGFRVLVSVEGSSGFSCSC